MPKLEKKAKKNGKVDPVLTAATKDRAPGEDVVVVIEIEKAIVSHPWSTTEYLEGYVGNKIGKPFCGEVSRILYALYEKGLVRQRPLEVMGQHFTEWAPAH